ncbi:PhnD/SsuA/transferrin family substrate-binding protein [Bradyrhizobium sp. NP1]|uniref:phosphate/phosphite/phosphonate ABC transporter substrate-binding protein n=1 Tax=Bradyrhizobium sp. NP1 TaxID=3049772 RepID=UPI0025A4F9C3|nr:PhnD/SsuA/transferrin family substrate-binding protein [Bradyrhizobium sp. NP1]WJR81291.1 PhnD/SsuA/transferrin family substrate-binding protein [Bradyrhizobium sp. NP1]
MRDIATPSADDTQYLLANARMYAVTDEAADAWAHIFEWLSDRTGVALRLVDHPPPAKLSDLWQRPHLGCVMMCGWPIAQAARKPHLLATPVPSPERYRDQPIYYTDIVVRRDRDYKSLNDTFGGTIGWTLEDSNSGFNMLRHHLLGYRSSSQHRLYSRSVGHLINPLGALRAVAEGTVDVAPVDSFCHDLLKAANHPYTALARTIETTAPSPMPALIASPDIPAATAEAVSAALLDAHNDARIAGALHAARIRRFERPDAARYRYTDHLASLAEKAGYPIPA